jgi:hypothetical protein
MTPQNFTPETKKVEYDITLENTPHADSVWLQRRRKMIGCLVSGLKFFEVSHQMFQKILEVVFGY